MQKTTLSPSATPGKPYTFVAKVAAPEVEVATYRAEVEMRFVASRSVEMRFVAAESVEV